MSKVIISLVESEHKLSVKSFVSSMEKVGIKVILITRNGETVYKPKKN
ncbi:hypothetical protein KAJ89_05090 [Candidatus Parcubacteria bacterium]|nr:hypothetical protein [Candidatus Parcubacteria bacterium]